jgi:hypothetical protein
MAYTAQPRLGENRESKRRIGIGVIGRGTFRVSSGSLE